VRRADREDRSDQPISLWWADLDGPESAAIARDLNASLSPDEQRRADRLNRPLDRERFRLARGWLRRLLAAQLGCRPGEVTLLAGEAGKPRIAGSQLRFSAARSEGAALYATSWQMEVGVDVEAIRSPLDVDGIAGRFFTSSEQEALAALSPERRVRAAYECWTRKEAYVKGIGAGLSFPLNTVDVWPGDALRATVGSWSIHPVDVGPGLAAAVAGAEPGDWQPGAPDRLTATNPPA
jgi:4'-phosphopantetheinyl transferase